MKNKFYIFFCLFLLIACNKNKQVTPISTTYELLNDNIMISTPGFFKISGDYLYLSDLKSADSIIHIFDTKSGKQLASFGNIGNGPNEFTVPIINTGFDGTISISNAGTPRLGILDAKKLLINNEGYKDLSPQPITDSQAMQFIDENTYLYLSPEKENTLFKTVDKSTNTTISWGAYPIKTEMKYMNYKDAYEGEINYDYYNNYLLLKFIRVPQIILFKKDGDQFKQLKTKNLSQYEYDIRDNKMVINYLEPCRTKMVSLTKDYIVLLDDSNISIEKRKEMKRPVLSRRQLILLDYKLEEQKVIDLNKDIYLIASDSRFNDVYLVVADPDYSIIKIKL